jgi:hypothetical protein
MNHFGIIYNGDNPISSEMDYIQNGEPPESWRKTPISSEMLDIENAKFLEQSVAFGIIQ